MLDNPVIVLGAPRSGTTWVGKIFDSHPDVLYRHEPDLVLREARLPWTVPDEEMAACLPLAREYLQRLLRTPTLKSAGQLPLFPKNYHFAGARQLRGGIIATLKIIEAATGSRRLRSYRVPDLVRPDRHPTLRPVMKSVTAQGLAGLFAAACPDARLVLVLRHPCGQISSTMRGRREKRFESGVAPAGILAIPLARKYGLTERQLKAASRIELHAWQWVVSTETAVQALDGRPNSRLLVYEELCREPIAGARTLFAFCGLDWNTQTETFIGESTTDGTTERYYGVVRDPLAAANRWRTELEEDDQRTIIDIVGRTPLAKYWPETAAAALPQRDRQPGSSSKAAVGSQ
ncbi:MAG: sulfotransferase [Acetobacteraceae bacterium]